MNIEEFLYHEARLLDTHRLEAWLDLYTDDATYWVPLEQGQQDAPASRGAHRAGFPDAATGPAADPAGVGPWSRDVRRPSSAYSARSSTAGQVQTRFLSP